MISINPNLVMVFIVIVAVGGFLLGLGLGYIQGLSDMEKLREEIKFLKGNP